MSATDRRAAAKARKGQKRKTHRATTKKPGYSPSPTTRSRPLPQGMISPTEFLFGN